MVTVTKTWQDLPAAHRQPNHDGHCRLIHGHNWRFDVTFRANRRDENGFVVDVGKLGKIRNWLMNVFDHTLLINHNDPCLEVFRGLPQEAVVSIREVPNCGMEGLAEYVATGAQTILNEDAELKSRKVRVIEVVCWEDSKNRATYIR